MVNLPRPRSSLTAHFWGLVRLAALLGTDDTEDVVQDAFVRRRRGRRRRPDVPGTGPDRQWRAAANEGYFASLVNGVLRVVARDGWKASAPLYRAGAQCAKADAGARLTAGDHLIAYTCAGASGVIDTRTLEAGRAHPPGLGMVLTRGPVPAGLIARAAVRR
ncbi:hypothetical protein ABZ914_22995 [Spirillospora sp. NPDC046719]